jgi:hypothetical protein
VKVEVELLQTDGKGNFTYRAHTNDGASISNPTVAGTYGVASNGRLNSLGRLGPVFYVVDTNEGFGIGTSTNVTSSFFEPQSTEPFSNASLNASYFFGQAVPSAEAFQFQTGEFTLDGAGNVSGTSDAINGSSDALSPAQSWSGQTYAISSTGRGTLSYNGDVVSILYVISPTRWVSIDIGPPNNVPSYPELQLSLE